MKNNGNPEYESNGKLRKVKKRGGEFWKVMKTKNNQQRNKTYYNEKHENVNNEK